MFEGFVNGTSADVHSVGEYNVLLGQVDNLDVHSMGRVGLGFGRPLAQDGDLVDVRHGLRTRMQASAVVDALGFTRAVEGAFGEMWKTWCAERQRAMPNSATMWE